MSKAKWCAALFALAAGAHTYAARAADDAAPEPVDFQWGVKIPLRDGVKLNATLYRPQGQKDALPCVFTLTPYISQSYHDRGMYFAANGYVYLTVDVRGRGNSDGEFTPLLQEARDGHDIVEWLATQPFCNGKTSMWGGSYAGYNQWATAKEFPAHLTSIVPVASPMPGVDYPMRNNIFYPYDMMWLTFVSGRASQDKIFGDRLFWATKFRAGYESYAPFATLDTRVGNPSTHFQTWISHPAQDAYWDKHGPSPQDFAKIDLPILSIVGQYDLLTTGGIEFYREHMRYASEAAKAKHYLVLGPWDHAGTRTPKPKLGTFPVGPAALVDMNALHKAWYEYTLKGGPRPEFLKKRVAYYVLGPGAEEWRYADTLEAVTAEERPYYLASDQGRANDIFHSGRLDREQSASPQPPDSYVYDPRFAPPEEAMYDFAFLTHHWLPMQAHGKQMLIYHGAPLTEATEIAGSPRLKVWLSLDQPDTDLMAWLYEVKPDGSNVLLGFDAMRARYRESRREARLVVPGIVEPYEFNEFLFIARRLEKGSRVRLVIGPTPRKFFEHNFNAGGVVSKESGKDARTVMVTLHHDAERPSALYLPMAQPLPR